jgi:Tol biopolymer transport system component
VDENKTRSLYVASTRGESPRRICIGCGNPHSWSPDGSRILVQSLEGDPHKAGWIDAETGHTKTLLEHTNDILDLNVSPDRRWLVFSVAASGGRTNICIAP